MLWYPFWYHRATGRRSQLGVHGGAGRSGPEPEIEALTEIPAEPEEVVLAEQAMANKRTPAGLFGRRTGAVP